MLLSYPLMTAIQEISARIGRVTGQGIAGNVSRNFGPVYIWGLVLLLFVANTINIAADLGAMGDALRLLIGGPAIAYVALFGAISVLAQIFFNYDRYVSVLKWLTLSLFAYVIALAVVKVPVVEALEGLLIRGISHHARRHPGHDDLSVPLYLAVLAGSRGAADRPGQEAAQERPVGSSRRVSPDSP